jgi:hypothetical protein
MGLTGWLSIMDADVLWPKEITHTWRPDREYPGFGYREGCLYTPRRRMLEKPSQLLTLSKQGPPPERMWGSFPLHPQQREFAGYTQIFHAGDPHLGPAPWHETNWRTAGGADSFFQAKWPPECKIRPPFEVLHLGESGVNWCGTGEENRAKLKQLLKKRGTVPGDRFYHEKLH